MPLIAEVGMEHCYYVSGGKDSVTMLIMAQQRNMEIDHVYFMDTRLEFEEMYDYLKKVENYTGLQIEHIYSNKCFETQFYKVHKKGQCKGKIWGFPYQSNPCWIQRDCKNWNAIDKNGTVSYIGITLDEQKRTYRKMYQNGNFRFPLIEWGITEQDCIEYLDDINLLNPLYDKFGRLGCWLCHRQSISSLESLYRYYPEKWKLLKQYESDSPHGYRMDYTLDELELKFNGLID